MTRKKAGQSAFGIAPDCGDDAQVSDLIPGWAGICAEVPKSRVQLWRDIRANRFPPPIEIGPNRIAWVRVEVEAWKASRPRRTYQAAEKAA
jgi:predicted DNA-binding transcriptional regulator AlpA